MKAMDWYPILLGVMAGMISVIIYQLLTKKVEYMVAWDYFNHHNRYSRIYCKVHIRPLLTVEVKAHGIVGKYVP